MQYQTWEHATVDGALNKHQHSYALVYTGSYNETAVQHILKQAAYSTLQGLYPAK